MHTGLRPRRGHPVENLVADRGPDQGRTKA